MPELAEVEWYRKQWNSGLGHKVVGVELQQGKYVFRGTDTRVLGEHLVGEELLTSTRRGKQMLFEFSNNNRLGVHLGMTGKTHAEAQDFRPGKYDRLLLRQKSQTLVFSDPRQLGHIKFHHGSDKPDWWKRTAPEIDSREFDQKVFDSFLDRHRVAPIKAVLLVQNGFPGIGNWMADEILCAPKSCRQNEFVG